MNKLTDAQNLVFALDQARTDLEIHLEPFRKQYFEFILELDPRYHNKHEATATSFVEVEGESFIFEGEEYYEYGDYVTPRVYLPFAFVADPDVFMDNSRAAKAAQEAAYIQKNEARAQERVELLRRQLAAAEDSLAKATKA